MSKDFQIRQTSQHSQKSPNNLHQSYQATNKRKKRWLLAVKLLRRCGQELKPFHPHSSKYKFEFKHKLGRPVRFKPKWHLHEGMCVKYKPL